jgi:hypothetical protein
LVGQEQFFVLSGTEVYVFKSLANKLLFKKKDAQKRHCVDTNFSMTFPHVYQAPAAISKRELHKIVEKWEVMISKRVTYCGSVCKTFIQPRKMTNRDALSSWYSFLK